jgi:hypothetical protein
MGVIMVRFAFLLKSVILLAFPIFSHIRAEMKGDPFTDVIVAGVESAVADFLIPKFKPVRLLSLHRGYFLPGWEEGKSLTIGYSFAIGAEGSHPFLFSVSFNRTYERVNLEFSFWPISFQFLPKFRLIRIGNIGGLAFGAGPILSFSKFPISGEFSLDLILKSRSPGVVVFFGLRFMDNLIEVNESVITPYVPIYNLRIILGYALSIKDKYKSYFSDKFILDKFILEGQLLGFGESGIFMLFGFAFNIRFPD